MAYQIKENRRSLTAGVRYKASVCRSLPQLGVAVADAAESEGQGVDVGGEALGLVDVDDLLHEQFGQVLVEGLAAGLALADGALQLFELAFDDVLLDDRRRHHDLD